MTEPNSSISGQILDICHALRCGGERLWSNLLHNSYYGGVGMDSLRNALQTLRRMEETSDVVERLGLTDQVERVSAVMTMAVSLVDPEPAPRGVSRETLQDLLSGLR